MFPSSYFSVIPFVKPQDTSMCNHESETLFMIKLFFVGLNLNRSIRAKKECTSKISHHTMEALETEGEKQTTKQ